MRRLGTALLAAVAVVVAVILFLVLRPESGPEPGEAVTGTAKTQPTETQGTETQGTAPTTTEEASRPGPLRIRIRIRGGRVAGPDRVELERGRRVVLIVRSDVADHVHVHGYDLFADVAPGRPTRISFTGDVPGRFEVELEDRHQLLITVVVTP